MSLPGAEPSTEIQGNPHCAFCYAQWFVDETFMPTPPTHEPGCRWVAIVGAFEAARRVVDLEPKSVNRPDGVLVNAIHDLKRALEGA